LTTIGPRLYANAVGRDAVAVNTSDEGHIIGEWENTMAAGVVDPGDERADERAPHAMAPTTTTVTTRTPITIDLSPLRRDAGAGGR
jgi:hypothetical protein